MVSLSIVKDSSYFTQLNHQSGHGVEYYSEHGLAESWWQGKLAEREGLTGQVAEQDIQRMTEGYDRVGLNVTYSAPKSVSLAYSLIGDERIKEVHEQAVRVANSWLEQNLAETRQGQGGAERVSASAVAIANFTHFTSRENDPQLHTHSVVLNAVERATDGKLTALEPAKIYEYQKALDQTYKNELARGLQELGYAVEMRDQHGNFEIVGFSQQVLDIFSTRKEQVLETAERLKNEGKITTENEYTLRDIAAIESRAEKQFLSAEELQKKWDEKLAQIGLTRDELRQSLTQCLRSVSASVSEPLRQPPEKEYEKAVEYVKAATAIIHENESAFTIEKLTEISLRLSMADAAKGEKVLSQKDISAAIQGLQQQGWIKEVGQGYFTTVEMQKKEQEIIHMVHEGQGKVEQLAGKEEIDEAIEKFQSMKGISMTNDQKQAVEHILGSRDKVIGIQGDAGTGKTTSLEVVKNYLQSQGYTVRGFAPTGKAADELAKVGIKSQTVDSFLARDLHIVTTEELQKYHELDRKFAFSSKGVPFLRNETPESWVRNQIQKQLGHQEFGVKQYAFQNGKMVVEWNRMGMNVFTKNQNGDITVKTFVKAHAIGAMVQAGEKVYTSPDRSILRGREMWVIDETSMLSSQKMHELLQRAKEADARVVFVGDVKQLASVGAGKMFEELQNRGMSTFRMKENIRQTNEEYRQLVRDLADKKFEQVMKRLQVNEVKDSKERVDMIVRDFMKDSSTIVVANRNKEVAELNCRIREELVKQGKVQQGEEYTVRVSKNLSAEEKKYSFSYSRGDVVFMQKKDMKEMGISTKQNEFLVKSIDHKNNSITITTPDMQREYAIDLAKYGEKLSVYSVTQIRIGVGDRLVSGKNDKELGLKNGQMWTVQGIQDGKLLLQNKNGQKTVDLSKYNYFSRGYCLTTHKAQGMTVRNVIVSAGKETNYQAMYTQVTRGKEQYTIYTGDKKEVLEKMQQDQSKTSSLPSKASEPTRMEQAQSMGR